MSTSRHTILEKLNPADVFTLAMDEEIRRDGLAGNFGCFALELDGLPDIATLTVRIDEFRRRFPVTQASLRRIGRHFYWCKPDAEPAPPLFHHRCPGHRDEAEFRQETITRLMNQKLARERVTPVEFHLLTGSRQTTFFIRWLHPCCDARGVDLILKYLGTNQAEERLKFGLPADSSLVRQQLDKYRWWQKIALFWKGKGYVEQLDKQESIQPFAANQPAQRLNYRIQRLSEAQTARVAELAGQRVGLTGTSLYYLGCLMRALEKMRPNSAGEAYCAPYAFNLRRQRALAPMTGNHISALFAQVPRAIVNDRQALFAHLKQQYAQVIRRRLDYAFLPLMWAGSWLSLERYGKTLRLSYGSGKERSSFWFSDIGRLDLPEHGLAGADISAVFQVCQVTAPPGFAFLSCIYRNRLTLSYNFVEPLGTPEHIERLQSLMLAELLEGAE